MACEAPQVRRRDARTPAASCSLQPVRCADAAAHAAQPGERWTLWVKQESAGTQYAEVEDVDPQLTVSKFKARWAAQEELKVRSSHITLLLVKCGPGKPTAAEEAAAVELDDPSLTLAAAGGTRTAWLLAKVAGARSERCAAFVSRC
jgi:hypothetical protein